MKTSSESESDSNSDSSSNEEGDDSDIELTKEERKIEKQLELFDEMIKDFEGSEKYDDVEFLKELSKKK